VWQPGGASAYSSLPVVFFLLLALRSLAVFIFCLSSLAATFIFFLLLALRRLAALFFCASRLIADKHRHASFNFISFLWSP
jgi:hypothetical protein